MIWISVTSFQLENDDDDDSLWKDVHHDDDDQDEYMNDEWSAGKKS